MVNLGLYNLQHTVNKIAHNSTVNPNLKIHFNKFSIFDSQSSSDTSNVFY